MHIAAKESKRDKIAKTNPEKAESYEWISEWDLYEEIKTQSSKILIDSDKGRQFESGACYYTFDNQIGKYIGFSLSHANNFFLVDDSSQTIPQSHDKDPSTKIDSMGDLTETVLNLLGWVNNKRL